MYPVGMSTCGRSADETFFRACAAANISAVEISPAQGAYDQVDYKEIRRLSEAYGVALWSFHLPFMPFETIDISAVDSSIRRKSVGITAELIEMAADIGITKFVIHPSGEPIADDERAERMRASKESLAALASVAAACGGALAVEDLPRTCLGNCSGEIKELLTADDRLRVCFDTNHLLSEDAVDFIHALGDRIITLHVSDYDFADEKHWMPGEGKMDWSRLLRALEEARYSGVWMYEVSPRSGSIRRSRDLTCQDFADNAGDLFAFRKPKRI